jgi:transcriptional regulator with XRE-family HTH domain
MTQSDIEDAIGLQRTYISRVEHGHTVPSLETLMRFAAALDVPLYRFFYRGEEMPPTHVISRPSLEQLAQEGGRSGNEASYLLELRRLTREMASDDRAWVLHVARRLLKNIRSR